MQGKRKILIGVVAAIVLGVPFGLIALYGGAFAYDIHRVHSLCAKLVPGTSLEDARKWAASVGLEQFMPPFPDDQPFGSYDASENNWYFSIPVAMEYGDERCSIYHDMHKVLKAEMDLL